MALVTPSRLSWAYAFSALFGIGTAVTTVIPGREHRMIHITCITKLTRLLVTALALSVPSFLLGTAGTISVACRALGGAVGITIFTAIYNNKVGFALSREVGEALSKVGEPKLTADVVAALLSSNPNALNAVAGLHEDWIPEIRAAQAIAVTYSWKYVWIAISVVVAVNALVSCSLQSVAHKMNRHIESALEESELRQGQLGMAK